MYRCGSSMPVDDPTSNSRVGGSPDGFERNLHFVCVSLHLLSSFSTHAKVASEEVDRQSRDGRKSWSKLKFGFGSTSAVPY